MARRKRMKRTITVEGLRSLAIKTTIEMMDIISNNAKAGKPVSETAQNSVDLLVDKFKQIDSSAYSDGWEDGYEEKLS